jgi:penicillin V acylase-like amidase (Ntn superfamily)
MVTKVTLNLPSELVEEIKQTAKKQNLTVTEIFRRSLQRDLFFSKEESTGGKVLVERPDGRMVEILRSR